MRLTDRQVAALPNPARGQKLYTDETIPGFGIRVSQGGSKTFVLTFGAERQRLTIGRWPIVSLHAARERAKTILAERQLGISHAPSPPLDAVIDEYLASREALIRGSTMRADRYYAKRFRTDRKIADITQSQAERLVNEIEAPVARLHGIVWLKGLFRFAENKGYLDKSPLKAVTTARSNESRERVLTDAELGKVIATARLWRQAGHQFGAMIELLVYLGQRREQIALLNRSMVNLQEQTIIWPPEAMKTGKRHTIVFGRLTRQILEVQPYNSRGMYFPSRTGTVFQGWSTCIKRFKADCEFDDWVPHDLRRSLATCWQQLGVEIATTERYLSHSAVTGGLVGIYQRHDFLREMRLAVEKFERHLERLIGAA